MADMKSFLAKVAAGERLTREEAEGAFDIIMSGEATPSQIGGFLMALRVRGETRRRDRRRGPRHARRA